jgi:hypothetical protein
MKGFNSNSSNMNFPQNFQNNFPPNFPNQNQTQSFTITKTDKNGSQNPADFFKNDFFNNDFFTNAMNQQLGMNGMNALIPTGNGKNKNITTTVTTDKNGKTVTNVVQVYHNIQNNNIHNNITNRITINISLKGLFTDEEIYEYMREQEEKERIQKEYEEYVDKIRKEELRKRGLLEEEDEIPKTQNKRGRKKRE